VGLNHNQRAKELLEWHGHDRGGVHVPFQQAQNPYGGTIPTNLVLRLRVLAQSIASGDASVPRWIFLVGGPGNGKSETVQDFLSELDGALGLGGSLRSHLAQAFASGQIIPRKVEVNAAHLPGSPAAFAQRVGRLIVVQDATATQLAQGNAARELAEDLVDLLTTPPATPPVCIVCANRGLLSRALREAYVHWGGDKEVTRLIVDLIRASSLGTESLATRPSCWPLSSEPRVACWPLDLESLLVAGQGPSPFEQVVSRAADSPAWEVAGRCLDCNSRGVCPFRQNAEWLRDNGLRENLRVVLRRGELASGQRWNFRDLFSLVAELVVGQWSDFGNADHPCSWVHASAQTASVAVAGVRPVLSLVEHLYPHAMFRAVHLDPGERLSRDLMEGAAPGLSRETFEWACDDAAASLKPIRTKLAKEYARLDPAVHSPALASHPLRVIEDHFSQSVELGKSVGWQPALTKVEQLLLEILDRAEHEWDLLGRDTRRASSAVQMLRRIAALLVKRSVGIRLGNHALEEYLTDYELLLRDNARLRQVSAALQPLLGEKGFQFNVVESFGQPTADEHLVTLEGEKPGIVPHAAPVDSPSSPGHDLPSFEITGTDYRMPLTFDFYLALQLRREGCAGSSLPASVRAALDRVRHRFAGKQFRRLEMFADGRARVVLGGRFVLALASVSSEPSISEIT
jgi:hypothetical protein